MPNLCGHLAASMASRGSRPTKCQPLTVTLLHPVCHVQSREHDPQHVAATFSSPASYSPVSLT